MIDNQKPLDQHPALITAQKKLKSLGLSQYEIFLARQKTTKMDARDGKVDSMKHSEDVGLSVRIIENQKIGFSFTTSLENDPVEKAIEAAYEIAQVMPTDPYNTFPSLSEFKYPSLNELDTHGLSTPIEEKIAKAIELEKICKQLDSRITAVRHAELSETFAEECIMDANGKIIGQKASFFSGSLTCKAEKDGDSQIGSEYQFSPHLKDLDLKSIAHFAVESAVELLNAKSASTMICPAVFKNRVVAELIEFLSSSFSIENMDKGRSLLNGKEGQPIFSKHISLIDDGLLPKGYGTSNFDAEGIPHQKTSLIDKGVFHSALYNSYYAKKLEKKPSGTSSRGIKSPPHIGFTNLIIEKGTQSFDSLIQSAQKGILITDLMGVHTANPITGDFSLGASGILIENGKLTQAVKGFAIAGNMIGLLNKVSAVGSDQRAFGNILTSSMQISELSIGGI